MTAAKRDRNAIAAGVAIIVISVGLLFVPNIGLWLGLGFAIIGILLLGNWYRTAAAVHPVPLTLHADDKHYDGMTVQWVDAPERIDPPEQIDPAEQPLNTPRLGQ
ncbi:MAG: hypothetical protein JWO10_1449 [Microbacteriaceae bacterium]|nr:hypothetical protein [Microbacteriaceae bacterium]